MRSRTDIIGVEGAWGYVADSCGKCISLFDAEVVVEVRRSAKKLAFTSCDCVDCKRRSFSCRKTCLFCPPSLCKKCMGKCNNCGLAPSVSPPGINPDVILSIEFFPGGMHSASVESFAFREREELRSSQSICHGA